MLHQVPPETISIGSLGKIARTIIKLMERSAVMLLLDRSDVDFAITTLEKQLEEEPSRASGVDRDVIFFAQQAVSMQPVRRMDSFASA